MMKTSKSCAIGLALLVCCAPAIAAEPDPVLARNATHTIRQSEFELELERVPPHLRDEFLSNRVRVGDFISQILIRKTLASQAEADKLDQQPVNAARMKIERERLLAQFRIAAVDEQATAEFNRNLAQHEIRAREIYTVDREKYRTPVEVSASHILLDTKRRSSDEARRLAEAARARITGGADFSVVAREVSEDGSVAMNGGALGWFTRDKMDPRFAAAAFAMNQVGAVSEPVQSQFGWHIIRLDGRRESKILPYEEVRDRIVAELRAKYVDEQRDKVLAAIRNDPASALNEPALEEIVSKARAGRSGNRQPAGDAGVKP
jgi:peptidyl-prolyl cis-trans isomerase C